ncbi:TBC1 domain family member 1-like isoform X2 [Mytilus californianus]|uniref:TBC1 domain family member 1-like isoform X2 n=1 Tax=Mytilus californianus TaxID=6549 RepID=UPI00224668C9|nr:TBC1 domain family member 1-like isoform X2 [Mytilus californianus]
MEITGEEPDTNRIFVVMYLGSSILDRRYPPQYVMPWVMAEVKRRKESFKEVNLRVLPHILQATLLNDESEEPKVLFSHKLICLSKFAKTHQDPRCFAYLSRPNLYCDYECHVFLAHTEEMVPELFSCIQEETRRDLFEDLGEQKVSEPAKAFYEIMYIGRAKLKCKKITCAHIDDLYGKLLKKEIDRKKMLEDKFEQRRRHGSGMSTKSLPATLEENVTVTENELQKQCETMKPHDIFSESPASSADELSSLSDQQSSTENVLDNSGHFSLGLPSNISELSDSGELMKEEPIFNKALTKTDNEHSSKDLHVHFHENSITTEQENPNRTMLFRLGANEVSLISLDKKSIILDKRFKDISSVSQGKDNSEVFGFIARENGNVFVCHVMKCHSFSVTDEIMSVLRSAFQCAFEQTHKQICIMCPLHQLHKLCQELNGLSSHNAYDLLEKRLHNLQEKDVADVHNLVQFENPQSYDEMVEILMIGLRKLCEVKQKEHTHLSDANKSSVKAEFNIIESKGKAALSFDSIKNKCKKSLTTSFESLILRGKKKEEGERTRHRSGTTVSEYSWTRSFDSSAASTPDCSPMPSPATMNSQQFHYPSPPGSPTEGRPRSQTLGTLSDTGLLSKKFQDITNLVKPKEKELELHDPPKRRNSMNSPMKQMFLLVGNNFSKKPTPIPDDVLDESDVNYTSNRRGSFRKTIFNSVVTPSRTPHSVKESPKVEETSVKKTPEEIRALWRKTILQTMLLIRMEKEKQDLKARQHDESQQKPDLDYEEITPCLKEVTLQWEEMLTEEDRDTRFSPQVVLDCVRKGVPKQLRGEIWYLMVDQHKLHYPSKNDMSPSREYQDLLKDLTEYQHNILIDLGRTFPEHKYFSTQLGQGQLALYNLLKAYSLLDREVGYCQGLSFIAGILLMHMDETSAFETLRHMMFNLGLRKQFHPSMMPLQIQLYQLTRLIHDNYRELHDHFEEHEIAPNLYATPWFLTLFASQYPLGFVARVFDLILMQGAEVILKVGLLLLGNHKELILQCNSFESIVEFIKTTLPELGIIQMERIIIQVFELDISKQLQAYEVEYHVLREEMIYSPSSGDTDKIKKLEDMNQRLKQQNNELLERLQNMNSHQHSLDIVIHNTQTSETKLKSHIKTLEIERKALLNAIMKLRQLIPEEQFQKLDILLPPLSPSLQSSPIHQPKNLRIGGNSRAHHHVSRSKSSPLAHTPE